MINCNAITTNPTHFLAAVELIKQARSKYEIPSETWPYPTEYKYGIVGSQYYSEVWVDGMDWQHTYWVLESNNYHNPKVTPFIMFRDHKDEKKFNPYNFGELVKALLVHRMDTLWIKSGDLGHYTDSVWPYIKTDENQEKGNLYSFYMSHASQPYVSFLVNINFIPGKYLVKLTREVLE